jgi:hypothetical protein
VDARLPEGAAGVGAGALQSTGRDDLDQPGDPARRAAAQGDQAGGCEQQCGWADARSERERQADQPEADRSARDMAGNAASTWVSAQISHASALS